MISVNRERQFSSTNHGNDDFIELEASTFVFTTFYDNTGFQAFKNSGRAHSIDLFFSDFIHDVAPAFQEVSLMTTRLGARKRPKRTGWREVFKHQKSFHFINACHGLHHGIPTEEGALHSKNMDRESPFSYT